MIIIIITFDLGVDKRSTVQEQKGFTYVEYRKKHSTVLN